MDSGPGMNSSFRFWSNRRRRDCPVANEKDSQKSLPARPRMSVEQMPHRHLRPKMSPGPSSAAGLSRSIRPRSTCCMTAIAVNGLETEAKRKDVYPD